MKREEQIRKHALEDGTEITQRLYGIEPGYFVWGPEKCCLFCENCRDLFYDYTNGPYMFICDKNTEEQDFTEKGCIGECDLFIENESVWERNDELERQKERLAELKKQPYYEELVKAAVEQIDKMVLFGSDNIEYVAKKLTLEDLIESEE